MYACAIIAGSFAAIFIYMIIDDDSVPGDQIEETASTKETTVESLTQPIQHNQLSQPIRKKAKGRRRHRVKQQQEDQQQP